jgi:hypothetical protein
MSIKFSSNLDTLLRQKDDNLNIQYRPRPTDESILPLLPLPRTNYHRAYDGDISIELDERPFTREMKTALVKRWLLIYYRESNEPQFDLHKYLDTNEVISCLFHLMELGDVNADNLYIHVNGIIEGSEGLLDWLNRDFKDSSSRLTRRQRLRFKYLYTKYTTKTKFQESTDEDILSTIEKDLPETSRQEIIRVINEARNTFDYTSKRQLVTEHTDIFKAITSKLEHFDILMDVDYFFLVFERLIEDNKETQKVLNGMVRSYSKIATNTFTLTPPPLPPRVSGPQPEQGTVLVSTEPETVETDPQTSTDSASPVQPDLEQPTTPGELSREEREARTLQEYYNLAVDYAVDKDSIIVGSSQSSDIFENYYLYMKMNDFDYEELVKYLNGKDAVDSKGQTIKGMEQSELDKDYQKTVEQFRSLNNEQKIQIIYGFLIASVITGIQQDNIRERVKSGEIDDAVWDGYYQLARKYNKFMRDVQLYYTEVQLKEMKRIAKNVHGRRYGVNPVFIDGIRQSPKFKSVDGVYVVDGQSGAKCGLHAINNLLQLTNSVCFATVESCEISRVLEGDTAFEGNDLQSQQLVAIINGGEIQVSGKELKKFPPFLNNKYHADFIPPNNLSIYDTIRNRKVGNKSFKGIIEKKIGHYIAWLLKGDNWYSIDSFGSITKYTNDEGIAILKSRLKVSFDRAYSVFEHIAVYEGNGDLGREDCFVAIPRGEIDEIKVPKAGGSKIRSKKRHFHKSSKKTKKISYN